MNPASAGKQLLEDVLMDAGHADFQETLLQETLVLARGRRRVRQFRNASAVVTTLCLMAVFAWRSNGPVPAVATVPMANYVPIVTKSFPDSLIVHSRPLAAEQELIPVAGVEIVSTTPFSGRFRTVNDDELLAMVPRPARLVRVGPDSQVLVFTNPGDRAIVQ